METHKDAARGRIWKLAQNVTGSYLISLSWSFLVVFFFWRRLEAVLHKHRAAHSSNAPQAAGLALAAVEAGFSLSNSGSVRVTFSFNVPGVCTISQIFLKPKMPHLWGY